MAEGAANNQLVVIGASAGGIEALGLLVAALPAGFPAPIVIAQHLDPTRPSRLAEILQQRCRLAVQAVGDELPLRAGTIYIVPSNHDVVISDHAVGIRQPAERGPRPSIDRLLDTAARVFGDQLIAVILSGLGSDGAAGARHVKEAGGTVIIQNPQTASFPAMPQSLAPTTVDLVADAEKIGPLLAELVSGTELPSRPGEASTLQVFLERLREQSGIDFSAYKAPTIMRRLHRRMVATGSEHLEDYVRFVQAHPDEYQRLVSNFLIKVTEFFRDPELFAYLRDEALPQLVAEARRRGNELRLWSAGCATGEEAYSLAILVCEALGDELAQFNVRIFATDLDLDAVAFARRGVYPAQALADVPADLVNRYFHRVDGEYEIKKHVRALTVFGQHDLGQRAPFPRIDLALCRNVLIYFTNELQKRALQLFAFSLRTGGYLVLGQAETTSPLSEYFAPEHPRLKIYRRMGDRVLIPPARIKEGTPAPPPLRVPGRRSPSGVDLTRRLPEQPLTPPLSERAEGLLFRLPIGLVVADRRYDIVTINNVARRAFGIHGAAIGEDLVHLARTVDPGALRSAIDSAFRTGTASTLGEVAVPETGTGEVRYYEVSCFPDRLEGESAAPADTVVVTVQDVTTAVQRRKAIEAENARQREEIARLNGLMEGLAETNRHLLEANQELTVANAELRSTNEEFLISNEEAQAATEEVETLNEELQATNEELETLNEELQATVEELNTTNDDLQARSVELQDLAVSLEAQRRSSESERARLQAVLSSMADAVMVVDRQGHRVLTNAAYDRLFGAGEAVPRDADGRALPAAETPERLAASGQPFRTEFTVQTPEGLRWFEANGQPIEGGQAGDAVVVIRDVSERSLRRLQEQFLATVAHELRTPLAVVQGYLQMAERRADDPSEVARLARSGAAQARRLDALIQELADVSSSQSGRLNVTLERVDARSVLERAAEVARTLADGPTIALTVPEDALPIQGDAERLEQVLQNLVGNALQHSGATRIELRGRRVGGRQVEIQVRDNGRGIPAGELPNVFSRFYRGARRDEHVGLGLGLYISREIVQAHRGTIDVSSRSGRGTTFTIRLPLAE